MGDNSNNQITFKVASHTNCSVLAMGMFKELTKDTPNKELVVNAIGAASLNQAIKAVASLNVLLKENNKTALISPSFGEARFSDSEKAYKLISLKIILTDVK